MKKMKRNIYLLVAGMAAMTLATSCSESTDLGNVSANKTVSFMASAGDADSRVGYAVNGNSLTCSWQSTDVINVFTAANISAATTTAIASTTFSTPTIASGNHFATFTGSFGTTTPTVGDALSAIVKSDNTAIFKVGSTVETNCITQLICQDGTLNGAESRNILAAVTSYKEGNIGASFSYKLAIIKLKLTLPSSVGTDADAEIALKGIGLKKSIKLSPTDLSVSESSNGDVIANTKVTGGTEKDVYLCVAPGTVTGLNVEVTIGNNVYTYAIGDKTIEAGKIYTKTVDLSSVTPVTYLFIENFSKFIYGGDDANMLPGIIPNAITGTSPNYVLDETSVKSCDYSADMSSSVSSDIFAAMGADYRTSRGISSWTGLKAYEHPGFLKLGTTSTNGYVEISAFTSLSGTKDAVLTFDAMSYDGNTANQTPIKVTVGTVETAITLPVRPVYQKAGEWQHCTVNITGATSATTIKIEGTGTKANSNVRFLLDNIRVK
jgi:hypothetical protein